MGWGELNPVDGVACDVVGGVGVVAVKRQWRGVVGVLPPRMGVGLPVRRWWRHFPRPRGFRWWSRRQT